MIEICETEFNYLTESKGSEDVIRQHIPAPLINFRGDMKDVNRGL